MRSALWFALSPLSARLPTPLRNPMVNRLLAESSSKASAVEREWLLEDPARSCWALPRHESLSWIRGMAGQLLKRIRRQNAPGRGASCGSACRMCEAARTLCFDHLRPSCNGPGASSSEFPLHLRLKNSCRVPIKSCWDEGIDQGGGCYF